MRQKSAGLVCAHAEMGACDPCKRPMRGDKYAPHTSCREETSIHGRFVVDEGQREVGSKETRKYPNLLKQYTQKNHLKVWC